MRGKPADRSAVAAGHRLFGPRSRSPETRDKHLLEHLPPDGCVGDAWVGPPPAVLPHGERCGKEALRDCFEIGFRVVEAEYDTTGPDPAQRQTLGTEIVLKHPVVA